MRAFFFCVFPAVKANWALRWCPGVKSNFDTWQPLYCQTRKLSQYFFFVFFQIGIREDECLSTGCGHEPPFRDHPSDLQDLDVEVSSRPFRQVPGKLRRLFLYLIIFQLLFLVVFLSRYLDLFTSYISVYNTCMKVIYIVLSLTTVYFIYGKFASTHNREDDK